MNKVDAYMPATLSTCLAEIPGEDLSLEIAIYSGVQMKVDTEYPFLSVTVWVSLWYRRSEPSASHGLPPHP
jgi:hypothetical protein